MQGDSIPDITLNKSLDQSHLQNKQKKTVSFEAEDYRNPNNQFAVKTPIIEEDKEEDSEGTDKTPVKHSESGSSSPHSHKAISGHNSKKKN